MIFVDPVDLRIHSDLNDNGDNDLSHKFSQLLPQASRQLSPDLPVKDAVYLFSNFASYMQSPHEKHKGVAYSDFRDTRRLLDFARQQARNPGSNVHVLHLKYRFNPGKDQVGGAGKAGGMANLATTAKSRKRLPMHQPFATLEEPVVKVDYNNEDGVFEPLPAFAIFKFILRWCQPLPRIIVMSYVGSHSTQNHLASLSAWARRYDPPIHIFSPLETRIRETLPIHVALKHAVPISMYAAPPTGVQCGVTVPTRDGDVYLAMPTADTPEQPQKRVRRHSLTDVKTVQQQFDPQPVATLTLATDDLMPVKRRPLWALAPGSGAWLWYASPKLGLSLSNYSAINLPSNARPVHYTESANIPQRPLWACMRTGVSVTPRDNIEQDWSSLAGIVTRYMTFDEAIAKLRSTGALKTSAPWEDLDQGGTSPRGELERRGSMM